MGFLGDSVVKNSLASAGGAGDPGSIPGSGRSPGGGNGSPLQYSCLENPVDRGAWQATVYGVTKSWKQQNDKTATLLTVGEIKDGRKQHQLFSQGIY